jgi:hypothetical protein
LNNQTDSKNGTDIAIENGVAGTGANGDGVNETGEEESGGGATGGRAGKRRALRAAAAVCAFLLLSALLLAFAQALVVPKYMSFPYEGGMVREYYGSGYGHSAVFIGDCEFYECVNPLVLWEEYGINSYVRGSSQQLIWHSYYYLLETLRYETPKVVVFNAVEMKIGSVQHEEYNRLTLDGLRLSRYKLEAAKLSLTEGESLLSYVFPILRYHSRWSELNSDDWKYLFRRDPVTFNGYLLMTGVKPRTSEIVRPLTDPSFPDVCWEYLDKIRETCAENGIELLIFKAPTNTWHYPWYDEWDVQLVGYAERYEGVRYVSAITEEDAVGIDWSTDTYDAGDHLNELGAAKVSSWIGRILRDDYGLPDESGDPDLSASWDRTAARYAEELAKKGGPSHAGTDS